MKVKFLFGMVFLLAVAQTAQAVRLVVVNNVEGAQKINLKLLVDRGNGAYNSTSKSFSFTAKGSKQTELGNTSTICSVCSAPSLTLTYFWPSQLESNYNNSKVDLTVSETFFKDLNLPRGNNHTITISIEDGFGQIGVAIDEGEKIFVKAIPYGQEVAAAVMMEN